MRGGGGGRKKEKEKERKCGEEINRNRNEVGGKEKKRNTKREWEMEREREMKRERKVREIFRKHSAGREKSLKSLLSDTNTSQTLFFFLFLLIFYFISFHCIPTNLSSLIHSLFPSSRPSRFNHLFAFPPSLILLFLFHLLSLFFHPSRFLSRFLFFRFSIQSR